MEHSGRKTVDIGRGIFLVRYTDAEDEACPPTVTVSPDSESEGDISLLLHPDHRDPILWQPGACLVVRASSPGRLSIAVKPSVTNGSAAATVRVEPLLQRTTAPTPVLERKHGTSSADVDDFRVLGHIAGIGDVVARANEWLAGPSAPSRIEGISIAWPGKPDDLEIRYAVQTAKPQTISGRMLELESFAGTRGKALALVGITLDISGMSASNFQLEVEAIFLGAPMLRVVGRRVVLSGPTGREPLVGLRVGLEKMSTNGKPQATPRAPRPQHPSNGVRVFRGRTKQDQSATS
jgi:hypothetical protein